MFVEPTFFEISGDKQAKRKEESGEEKERATAGMAGRDAVCTAIVGILRWWEREGSLIGELSSDPEMMFLWRRRFQGGPLLL